MEKKHDPNKIKQNTISEANLNCGNASIELVTLGLERIVAVFQITKLLFCDHLCQSVLQCLAHHTCGLNKPIIQCCGRCACVYVNKRIERG